MTVGVVLKTEEKQTLKECKGLIEFSLHQKTKELLDKKDVFHEVMTEHLRVKKLLA
ncbi:MAG: hypothetical protein ACI9IL_000719 [Rickettsiales bacterium]|jgi:hypothetical protein